MEGSWTAEDYFSEYFHTWEGQMEYWLMWIFYGAMKQFPSPPFWFGAQNDMALYLIHPSYSPFVDHPRLGSPKMPLKWSMKNPPPEQRHLLDENFLPKKLNNSVLQG